MIARVLLFDTSRVLLVEAYFRVGSVSWRLNRVGQARLFSSSSDAKSTTENLQIGNYILIQFDNGLPDWGGIIDLPRNRTQTEIGITAYSGERALASRRTLQNSIFDSIAAGDIYKALIIDANTVWSTGIEPGTIYSSGVARTQEYHYAQILQQIQELARLSGNDFYIQPVFSNNRLTFKAHWYETRGNDLTNTVWFVEKRNIVGGVALDEQGMMANRITLVGSGNVWDETRLVSVANDTEKQALYGLREYAEIQTSILDQTTLDANAASLLAALSKVEQKASFATSDKKPGKYSTYDVGDIVHVQALLRPGATEWAIDLDMRVMGREWRNGACFLELEGT